MNVKPSLAIIAGLLLSASTLSAQMPSPEEIFARHVNAIGGRHALLHVSSMKTTGTLQMVSMGITAHIEAYSAAPNRMVMRLTVPGIGEIANGFDGIVAWELNPLQGPRIKNEKETIAAQEESDFYGAMLFSKNRYQSCETVGQAEFGGERTWQVKTVLKSGRVVDEYFSVATGLKVGSHAKQENAQGILDVITVESEYKQFGVISLPTRSEMTTGPSKMLVTINSVELGAVPDSAFALPAPIKALLTKP